MMNEFNVKNNQKFDRDAILFQFDASKWAKAAQIFSGNLFLIAEINR